MKRLVVIAMLLLAAMACMGMGGLGGYPEGTVPETDVRLLAKVVDRAGVETSLNQFSMDGKTYLDAWRGQGQLTIPFQQIATISFGEVKRNAVVANVTLKSGNSMELGVSPRAIFYGSTGFGAYRVKSKDLSLIEFP